MRVFLVPGLLCFQAVLLCDHGHVQHSSLTIPEAAEALELTLAGLDINPGVSVCCTGAGALHYSWRFLAVEKVVLLAGH